MAYWTRLNELARKYTPILPLKEQMTAMDAWQRAVANHRLPQHALPWLGLTAPQIEHALALPDARLAELQQLDHLLHNFRRYIAFHYGMWSFVHTDFFNVWHHLYGSQRYLEVAAGNGYVSAGLRAQGDTTITTDAHTWVKENVTGQQPLVPVKTATANASLFLYADQVDAVVMAWSPDKDPNDVRFLHIMARSFPDKQLFVIGERQGATNSRLFWQEARQVPDRRVFALNRALGHFDAIHERVYRLQ
ncbi:SAM-dependent methyltransferase [Lacticaseibacillus parahuelsenbergensis]|uniref:SAM-dependent methyltransferase n=1 Tax=Lacticaseibacillus parahuelsenbergensis TaxID=3068305 RepID=A0ABY9L6I1_9LACO|nr:SAM-dependent methyltransferase [Lacticaseibacillus sp. NCIMB 15471]WLV79342.1 SAM-dependent methyltransferase [Lacticaseibacillus sp. NCIMB 15471]